ncbi:jasmonate-zim-domain protein 3 [Prunus dulcis]|uniref:Protein TIFY n=1 Tax=Prunus dulcis TaxID=3755 RepID=A0A4Y1RJD4_PRUDU|nr:jasmonate-zim-domain protein 3 [Prunus dulcis]
MSHIQRKELFFLRWLGFKGLEVHFLLLACNLAKRLELMERDFLGLSSKNGNLTVKEEANEEAKNSALPRSSGMQWSFSNKVSALPQFLSFKAPQEGGSRKTVHDTSAFMTISTAMLFTSARSHSLKNFTLDKQAGNHYAMTVSPVQQFDAHSVHHSQDQRIPVGFSTPLLQSHPPVGQNMAGSTTKLQPLGGVPVVPLNASKSSGAPAQLTIFYAGSVNVYDDISPEKAQAIMLLAGNGPSPTHCKAPTIAQVPAPIPRPSPGDGVFRNQAHITSTISGLPSHLSVTSHASSHSGGAFSSTNELAIVKPVGTSASPIDHSEASKVVSSVGSAMTNLIPAVPVPQARKASLARFFEKRKERMMTTLPYNVSKKSPECSTPGSDGLSFSINSSGSCPPQAIN